MTAPRVGTLDPGATYAGVYEILLYYFPAVAWEKHEASIDSSDPLFLDDTVNSLEEKQMAAQKRLAVQHKSILSTLPDLRIESITDIWFARFPYPDGE